MKIWNAGVSVITSSTFSSLIYLHTQVGGNNLGLVRFFWVGFLEEKIVLIYYTNGGVWYWIQSNYLNKHGLYVLRVWFLPMGCLYGCFTNLGFQINLLVVEFLLPPSTLEILRLLQNLLNKPKVQLILSYCKFITKCTRNVIQIKLLKFKWTS